MVERLDPSKNTSIDFELVQKGACVRVTDESSARLSVIDLVSALVGVNHVQARLLLLPYTGREAFDVGHSRSCFFPAPSFIGVSLLPP